MLRIEDMNCNTVENVCDLGINLKDRAFSLFKYQTYFNVWPALLVGPCCITAMVSLMGTLSQQIYS